MQPYPITGYPQGADADSIGALIAASNGVLRRSGAMGKRTGVGNFFWGFGWPETPSLAMFGLGGTFYSVNVETSGGSPGLILRKNNSASTALISRDVICRSSTAYRKLLDDMLDVFKTQEGAAVQINCFPPVTTDGTTTVESGAPRCREISLLSEVDASTLTGGQTALTALGIKVSERCAYRAVFSYVRTNGAEVSGPPSGRFIYSRGIFAPAAVCPRLQIALPNNTPAYYAAYPGKCFVSLYRSSILTAKDTAALGVGDTDPSPGDDMYLVFKTAISSAQSAAGVVALTEVCPEGMTGEALYTNAAVGGTSAERWMPPKCNSAAIYKDTAFYAGAVDRYARMTFSLVATPFVYPGPIVATATTLKIPSTDLTVPTLANGDIVSICGPAGATPADYVVNGAVTVSGGFIIIPVASPPAAGSYPGAATFGKLLVTVTDPVGGPTTYSIRASFAVPAGGTANKFQVPLAITQDPIANPQNQRAMLQAAAANICQGINITLWAAGHNVVASNLAAKTLEDGRITVEADQATALSIAASDVVSDYRSMAARLAGTLASTPDAGLNSLWWSTPGIYDHVCPGNRRFFGAPDKEFLKVIATRDSLYLFKEDGTWVLNGSGDGVWGDTVLSLDLQLLAPSLVTVYKDQVFAATNMGIVELTGGTITVLSDTIRDVYHRMLLGRVNPTYGASLTATYADIFCNSCAASWADGTISFSIPILTTPVAGVKKMAAAYRVFTYCYDSRQWLVSEEYPVKVPAAELAGRGGGTLPEQYVVPLTCRPAVALSLDAATRQILRLPLPAFINMAQPSYENIAISTTDSQVAAFSDETGRLMAQGSDLITASGTPVGGNKYHLVLSDPHLSLGLLPAPGTIVDPAGPDQWYWVESTTGTMSRVAQFVARDVVEFILDPNPALQNGAFGTLICPIQTRWRFAPIGNGSSALNFNQIALLLSREAAASRIQWTIWLDDGKAYPYVAPTKVVLNGDSVSRNVVRAAVDPAVTRGSRATIEIYHGVANERLELSKLLLDVTPTPGEEVQY